MAYRFRAGETIPEGVKRIVTEEIESATALLRGRTEAQHDKAVHEARKSIKKIRGMLRLLRPELGRAYADENKLFREVGQQLSQLRDAAALLEVFDQLLKQRSGVIERKTAGDIRRGLALEKDRIEQQLDITKVIGSAARALRSAQSRVKRWPMTKDGFGALAPGFELTYRSGRKTLRDARKKGDAAAYHEFRKRVKDHWYHVRLFESVWTEVMQAHEASLKKLETWLGDDHNLAVLREKLEARPESFGGQENVAACLLLVSEYQKELRANAISLGVRVYAEKPGMLVRSVSALWKTWQDRPKIVKQAAAPGGTARKPAGVAAKKAKTSAA